MTHTTMEAHSMRGDTVTAPRFALGALFCWSIAALGCHLALMIFDDALPAFGARLVVILVSGALLGKLAERLDTREALWAGMAWAALAIGVEIFFATEGVTGWFELLGNPVLLSDWMRGATIVAWVLAPGLSARASE